MNLTEVINLLNSIALLEPVAQNAIMQFIQRLEDKSTDEILNESDAIWSEVLDTAKREQGQ